MKKFKFQIPKALVHLRDGVVTSKNSGLKRAILDLITGRLSQVTSIFYFNMEKNPSFFYLYKRIWESYQIAEEFENYKFDMKLSLNFSTDSIYSQMIKSDSSIFYTTFHLPEYDEYYVKLVNKKLVSFDIVDVNEEYQLPDTSILPYWKRYEVSDLKVDEIDYGKINLFFNNPLYISNYDDLFDIAKNLYNYLREEI